MMARGLATAAVAACLLLAGAGAVQVKVAAYDEPGSQGEVRARAAAVPESVEEHDECWERQQRPADHIHIIS